MSSATQHIQLPLEPLALLSIRSGDLHFGRMSGNGMLLCPLFGLKSRGRLDVSKRHGHIQRLGRDCVLGYSQSQLIM